MTLFLLSLSWIQIKFCRHRGGYCFLMHAFILEQAVFAGGITWFHVAVTTLIAVFRFYNPPGLTASVCEPVNEALAQHPGQA